MIVHVLLHLANQLWKPSILIAFYNEFNTLNNIGPHMSDYHMGLVAKKNCILWFGNNKGRDQSAFQRSLISAFCYSLIGKYHI